MSRDSSEASFGLSHDVRSVTRRPALVCRDPGPALPAPTPTRSPSGAGPGRCSGERGRLRGRRPVGRSEVPTSTPSTTLGSASRRSGEAGLSAIRLTTPKGRRSPCSPGSPGVSSAPHRPSGRLVRQPPSTTACSPCTPAPADPRPSGRPAPPARPEDVSSFPPRTPEEERKALHLPPGFEIQLVAAEPEIHKPMNIAFDDRGRLWVTDTLEYPFPAAEAGTKPRDTVKVLEDFGPDGRARKIRDLRRRPEHPDRHPAAALGDRRRSSTASPTSSSCATPTATARPTRARSLYGAFGHQRHARHDQRVHLGLRRLGLRLPRLLQRLDASRARTSGRSRMQVGQHLPHAARRLAPRVLHPRPGQPVRPGFDPLGNLYSCDCHSRPIYQLLRGASTPASASRTTASASAPR